LFIAAGPVLAASTAPNVPGTLTITVPHVTLLLAPTSAKELLAEVFAFPWSAASSRDEMQSKSSLNSVVTSLTFLNTQYFVSTQNIVVPT